MGPTTLHGYRLRATAFLSWCIAHHLDWNCPAELDGVVAQYLAEIALTAIVLREVAEVAQGPRLGFAFTADDVEQFSGFEDSLANKADTVVESLVFVSSVVIHHTSARKTRTAADDITM